MVVLLVAVEGFMVALDGFDAFPDGAYLVLWLFLFAQLLRQQVRKRE